MILIVGLGNPGEKFTGTRHNVGRELLMAWQKETDAADFIIEKKLFALVSKNKKAVLLLPETFMNASGRAVASAARWLTVKPDHILIIHDDADMELGRTKLVFNRGSGGHKGIESVRRALKTEKFWRLKIGIQPPARTAPAKSRKKKRVDAMKLVLQKFTSAEIGTFKRVRKKIFEGLDTILNEGPERTMNILNQN